MPVLRPGFSLTRLDGHHTFPETPWERPKNMSIDSSRRQFLFRGMTGASAVWLSANWPSLVAAASHARDQAKSSSPKKLEFLTSEEALEVEAVSERILPADDTPGAREAGVVYFIDRALLTFAKAEQKTLRDGLPALHALTRSMFPQYATFSRASAAEQDQILHRLDQQGDDGPGGFAAGPAGQNFFGAIRWLTVAGFLVDPDTRGNPAGIGWKLIGRDREHAFQPPFGYYDKDYPGWQPAPSSQKDGAGQ